MSSTSCHWRHDLWHWWSYQLWAWRFWQCHLRHLWRYALFECRCCTSPQHCPCAEWYQTLLLHLQHTSSSSLHFLHVLSIGDRCLGQKWSHFAQYSRKMDNRGAWHSQHEHSVSKTHTFSLSDSSLPFLPHTHVLQTTSTFSQRCNRLMLSS